ncbi:trypsin-like serine protease [Arthrobacter sp. W4I7]|uniref:S1 family peptidase n=1 Tax=Arthrobacter sp. W4I7 TaxID=3042296 RepID=UPI0027895476|nr:trypsin-like serine protease [Arthrobacter sp. W4I7]MDQ0690013.1 V8-like Glu-specific endopeptidase [Arthrobacter sp. W4I7]
MRVLIVLVLSIVGVLFPATMAGAIIGGTDDGSRHPYVGFIQVVDDLGAGYCTAVAISPTVVLTAAHCVTETEGPTEIHFFYDLDGSGFTFDTGLEGFDGKVAATAYVYPGFCAACGKGLPGYDKNDLAVLVLDQPIELPRYAQLPTVGQVTTLKNPSVTYVGYGVIAYTAGGGTPQQIFDYNFRRQTAMGSIITNKNVISTDFVSLSHAAGIRTCQGDSGSPILFGDTVLALLSFSNGQCTGGQYAFRIDSAEKLAFIRSFL